MKFTQSCLLAACVVVNTSATSSPRKNKSNVQRRTEMQQKLLSQKAVRVGGRQAAEQQEEQQGEQQDFSMTFENYPLAYEVRYKSCGALPVFSQKSASFFQYNDPNHYMAGLAASGYIGAQQSYVFFDVCKTSSFGSPFVSTRDNERNGENNRDQERNEENEQVNWNDWSQWGNGVNWNDVNDWSEWSEWNAENEAYLANQANEQANEEANQANEQANEENRQDEYDEELCGEDGGSYMIDMKSWIDIITYQDLVQYEEKKSVMSYDEAYCQACAASIDFCEARSAGNVLASDVFQSYGIGSRTALSYLDFSLISGNSSDSSYDFSTTASWNWGGTTTAAAATTAAPSDGTSTQAPSEESTRIYNSKFTSSEGQLFGFNVAEGTSEDMSILVSCPVCNYRCGNGQADEDEFMKDYNMEYEEEYENNKAKATEEYAEFAQQLSECIPTNSYYDENMVYPLYAGLMCNATSNRIVPTMFLDEKCTLFQFQEDYAAYMSQTDSADDLFAVFKYMQSLDQKAVPLYRTPTPLSWPDALENFEKIVEFTQGKGGSHEFEEFFQQMESAKYAAAENADGNADYQNGNENAANDVEDEYVEEFEQMWWQAFFEGSWQPVFEGGKSENGDLLELDFVEGMDMTMAMDVYECANDFEQEEDANGNIMYYDATNNVYLDATSTITLQWNGEDENEQDLTVPCAVIGLMGGNYSALNLTTPYKYYAAYATGEAVAPPSYTVWVKKSGLRKAGYIVLIVLAAVVGSLGSLWAIRHFSVDKSAQSLFNKTFRSRNSRDKRMPLITENDMEEASKASTASTKSDPDMDPDTVSV